jgi:spore photoproduct lyase
MQPRYVNIKHVLGALDYIFAQNQFNEGKPTVFNSGELADSWMNPENMIKIVKKFEEQDKHKILTLTKFGVSNPMLKMLTECFHKQTIAAFSINATRVAKLYETTAPQPLSRIRAASQLSDQGYDVRVRIDPIFPIDGWQEHYQDVIYSILSKFEPRRVILGTPRGLRKTIAFGRKAGVDLSWVRFLERKETGWGWKLPFEIRLEIYRFLYEKLLALGFPKDRVSICKETLEMWKELKLNYVPLTCNCYGRG